jgi:asparagine synthase (glutamine-hydrolysing)
MSGLVVGYGAPGLDTVGDMLSRIAHRGNFRSGRFAHGKVAMAQNYLHADCPGISAEAEIPVPAVDGPELRICYDGQIAGAGGVHGTELTNGPFAEEQAILSLYRQYGTGLFEYIDDAIFSFVISDGSRLLAARDLFGIKTLYYGYVDQTIYLATELKSLVAVTSDVYEFPPGHYMDEEGRFLPFATLPDVAPTPSNAPLSDLLATTKEIITRSVRNRIDFAVPTGSLLSGGLDSSVISYLASEQSRQAGRRDPLPTFVMGLEGSGDLPKARLVAEQIGSDHHEVVMDLDAMLPSLPDVIYYLESFDPSLVRSALGNFLVTRYAKEQGIEVLLSGEGGDEMFGGYAQMKSVPPSEIFDVQMSCFRLLHNNAALRLDHMNQCSSMRVVAPLVSDELFRFAMTLPAEYKVREERGQTMAKWLYRKAFEADLPEEVVWRPKLEFSQGTGLASLLPERIGQMVSDGEWRDAQSDFPFIRSKEELYYFRLFAEHFGTGRAVETVGQWVSL